MKAERGDWIIFIIEFVGTNEICSSFTGDKTLLFKINHTALSGRLSPLVSFLITNVSAVNVLSVVTKC